MQRRRFLATVNLSLAIVLATFILGAEASSAITRKILHRFSGGVDGGEPHCELVLDASGDLYGTTLVGGAYDLGTVFELTPHADGHWTKTVLYSFTGGAGGSSPAAGVIFDAAGNLYGTAVWFGSNTNGTVYKLTHNQDDSWTYSVLHSFTKTDGSHPVARLTFDAAGNLYGTTSTGGGYAHGVVFELTPNADGSWTEHVLHRFTGGADGSDGDEHTGWAPALILDKAGNIYGAAPAGGVNGFGNIYELKPNPNGSWTQHVLHQFTGAADGAWPYGTLVFGSNGSLYGTTSSGGTHCCNGNVFELTPDSNGAWALHVLHEFNGKDGSESFGGVVMDGAGNLYGTTAGGGGQAAECGIGCGLVFKLTPTTGKWVESIVWSFNDQPNAHPEAELVFDGAGNLYGTTGGAFVSQPGTVFEVTP